MPARTGIAHVVTTIRKYKDRIYRTHLLRRSYREGGTVKNETLGNLSHLPEAVVDVIRRMLQGETFVPVAQAFQVIASRAQGHVRAVAGAMERLGFARVLASAPSRERDVICALVAARVIAPQTKLATTRWWQTTTLADDFGVADVSEDDCYAAMDWLLARQDRIQKKLAARHLQDGGLVLYDLTSSYFEGSCCPLAKRGYSRDGRRGTLQVNYGVITNAAGCPVAVSVYDGNTADSRTFLPAVHKVRDDFGIAHVVMVGDRGMISSQAIDAMRDMEGMDWVTALKTGSIRALVEQGHLQLDLFDERNLLELTSPDYPGERLVACRNPHLAKKRALTREDLLVATERGLAKIRTRVAAGTLKGADAIGVCVGRIINQYHVAKHVVLTISDRAFSYARDDARIAAEAALDGLYIIRTSLSAAQMEAAQCVRTYKSLSNVERAFRALKTVDLHVRPIHHRTADRVRAHIFLCVLAYYVEWHLRDAWRDLLFADPDQAAKATRDPVAPAVRSKAAQAKASHHTLDDGTPTHSFATVLAELATIVRNTCRTPHAGPDAPTFDVLTTPNAKQQRAFTLLQQIHV